MHTLPMCTQMDCVSIKEVYGIWFDMGKYASIPCYDWTPSQKLLDYVATLLEQHLDPRRSQQSMPHDLDETRLVHEYVICRKCQCSRWYFVGTGYALDRRVGMILPLIHRQRTGPICRTNYADTIGLEKHSSWTAKICITFSPVIHLTVLVGLSFL